MVFLVLQKIDLKVEEAVTDSVLAEMIRLLRKTLSLGVDWCNSLISPPALSGSGQEAASVEEKHLSVVSCTAAATTCTGCYYTVCYTDCY